MTMGMYNAFFLVYAALLGLSFFAFLHTVIPVIFIIPTFNLIAIGGAYAMIRSIHS